MTRHRHLIGLPLVGLMILASVTLAAGRGALAGDGRVMLCSGATVLVLAPGAEGPGPERHICPDFGLSLLADGAPAMAPAPPLRLGPARGWTLAIAAPPRPRQLSEVLARPPPPV